MKQKEISYQKAEEIVRLYLQSIDNLSKYSQLKKLSYQSLLAIKNNKVGDKQFSNLIFKVLKDMGYKPKVKVIRIIKDITYTVQEP